MQSSSRIDILDGLRGLAILMVMFAHAGCSEIFYPLSETGHFGVVLFFTLSGFLITYHYIPRESSWLFWKSYALRRAFRIMPLYTFVLIFGLVFSLIFEDSKFSGFSMLFVAKHFLLIDVERPFIPAYSIMVEMRFYVFFAVLISLLKSMKKLKESHYLAVVLLIWICFAIWKPAIHKVSLFTFLPYFLAGMATALLYVYQLKNRVPHWRYDIVILLCLGISIPAALPEYFHFFKTNHQFHVNAWLFSAVIGGIMWGALHSIYVNKLFNMKYLRFTGTISYSLYLSNNFVFWFVQHNWVSIKWLPEIMTGFLLTFIISLIMHYLIEKPFINMGKNISRRVGKQHIQI